MAIAEREISSARKATHGLPFVLYAIQQPIVHKKEHKRTVSQRICSAARAILDTYKLLPLWSLNAILLATAQALNTCLSPFRKIREFFGTLA